jgi:hypothetical protein
MLVPQEKHHGRDPGKTETVRNPFANRRTAAGLTMNEIPNGASDRSGIPSVLRQFARRRDARERCELCSAELALLHSHLLEPAKRQILCACEACSLLFCGQNGGRYLRIPHRISLLSNFQMTDMEWEALMIPINLAFFYHDSASSRMIAMYPSPAGATESLLTLESWEEVRAQNRALQTMEPDVEALLVNRVSPEHEYFIVPIDECFRLVGIIRMHWKGLSGGTEVWKHIQQFFNDLRARCTHAEPKAEVVRA